MSQAFELDVSLLVEVLDRLNVGIYVTDMERRILLWNRKAEEITGYKSSQVVGTACWDNVLQHNDRHGHRLCTTNLCPLFRAITTGKPSDETVLVFAKKADGRRVAVAVSVAPLRNASGEVIGGIEVFTDETRHVLDMEFARKVQQSILPRKPPETEAFRFDVRYYPHDLVGGDFYDVADLGEGRVGILLADVRGHGVSAALYTMWLKSLEGRFSERAGDPAGMIAALNRTLSRFVVPESFATALYAVADGNTMTLSYTGAGHPPPLHLAANSEEAAELESHGLPLALSSDEEYGLSKVSLKSRDMVLFYTDGLTDIGDKDGKMMDSKALADVLCRERARGGKDIAERIYRSILAASGQIDFPDDCTVLVLEVK